MGKRGRHIIRPKRKRRIITSVIVAVVLPVLLVGGIALKLAGNVKTIDVDTTAASEPDGPLNILIIGSDSRSAGEGKYGEDDGSGRSDSMVLAHLSEDDSRVDAVQIPRDLTTEVPACEDDGFAGGLSMINATFEYGPGCAVKAVQEVTGVPVHHFVVLDFDGFAGMVDAIGGIEMCLEEPVRDELSMVDLDAGRHELDGEQALALARTRHAFGDGSDIARLEHQQLVMSSIAQKATSQGVLTRPDRLVRLLDAVTKSLTVDDELGSVGDMTGLARRLARVPLSGITFQVMPWQPASFDENRVEMTDEARTLFAALRDDVPPGQEPAAEETTEPADPAAPEQPEQPGSSTGPSAGATTADTSICG
ncbi:LCP family protein [Aeromicrobium piscarium]|uniref:Transcriptional regulator n=1 Tax=Aeromicrobium piscarium TaxID=2590901 RepID=A0A554SDJ5_9ACTN|nr:LCP family protein [Aeromicrobium piscarium]TSD64419.1 transcriptional regulator [Aeromicrobium piscarium]